MLKWLRSLFSPVPLDLSPTEVLTDDSPDQTPVAPPANPVVEHARKTAQRYEELLGGMSTEDRAKVEEIEKKLLRRRYHGREFLSALENKRREIIRDQLSFETYEKETKGLRAQIVPLVARNHPPIPLPKVASVDVEQAI